MMNRWQAMGNGRQATACILLGEGARDYFFTSKNIPIAIKTPPNTRI